MFYHIVSMILFFLLSIVNNSLSYTIELHPDSSDVFNIYQNSEINVPSNDSDLILLVENKDLDTIGSISQNNVITKSASWMGVYGNYFIFIPKNSIRKITLSPFESNIKTTKVRLTLTSVNNYSTSTIKALKLHIKANNLRVNDYLNGTNNYDLAIKLFANAESIFKKEKEFYFSSISSFEKAITQNNSGYLSESIISFEHAIKYLKVDNDSLKIYRIYNRLGLVYWQLNQLNKAEYYFSLISNSTKLFNNIIIQSQALSNLGLISYSRGEMINAINRFSDSLKLNNINLDYISMTNNRILKEFKEHNNLKNIAATLNNLALAFKANGQSIMAEKLLTVYLYVSSNLRDINTIAKAKNNLSTLLIKKGHYAQAIKLLKEARNSFEQSKNYRWLSLTHQNLAKTYKYLGLYMLAKIHIGKSIKLINRNNDPKGLIESNTQLIEIYINQRKYKAANSLIINTLKLAEKHNLKKEISKIIISKFKLSITESNYNLAEDEINIAIKNMKNTSFVRLDIKLNIYKSKLFYLKNNYLEAIRLLIHQIDNLKNTWDSKLLNTANNLLAQTYIKHNELDKAESTINNEINNIRFYLNSTKSDKIRSDLSRMLKETLGIYNTITALQHKPELGFIKTNKMLANYRALKKKNRNLQSSLSEASVDDLFTMINNKTLALENNKLSDEDKKHIQNDIIELKAKIDFSFAASINNNTEEFDLKEIQTKLDDNSLVIQFSISDAGGVAWWISQDKFHSFILEDKESIAKLVTKARATFMQENNNYQAISDLSDKLFSPLKSFNGIKKIFLILDEPLNLIPFNALKDPRFNSNISIAENTSIQRISSIKSVFKLDRKHGKYKSIIIADPITSQTDVRLSHIDIIDSNTISFNRLLGTKSEALNISKIIDAKILQGFEANKSHFMNLNFSNFNIIHFATHAFFHQDIPGLSSLVLSNFNNKGEQQPSFLRGLEISNLNLNGKLIVLSGCETGVGNHDNSLGLDGLTQSFMQAGAKNLIASLWKVDDRITEKMMVEFYKNYSQGMSIVNALRKAQSKIRNNPRTRHPKYWAGWFLLSN